MCKTAFSARDQHVLLFSHWAHQFLVIFSKEHESLQDSIFDWRLCGYLDLISNPLIGGFISYFQHSSRVCPKQRFQPDISTFCHFCTDRTTFQRFSAKCTTLYKTAFFSPRSARFLISPLTLREIPIIQEYSSIEDVFLTPMKSRVFRTRTSEYPLFRIILEFC